MPAVSQAQRAYLNVRFGHAWVKKHHFDNRGKLPPHVIQRAIAAKKKKKKYHLPPGAKPQRGVPQISGNPASGPPTPNQLSMVKDMLLLRSAARGH